MIEEFDAIQRLNLTQSLIAIVSLLLGGVLLEVALRFGRRWALSREYTWLSAILNALTWLLLFWTVLLGITPSVLHLIKTTSNWQLPPGLSQTLLWISITIFIVRLFNGLLRILTATTPSASVSLLNNMLAGVGTLVVVAIVLGYLFNVSFIVLLLTIVGGIAGLTVIFQEPLNNLVSGVSLTVSDRLTPGDWIRLPSGIEGYVRDIQWDVTMIQQITNNLIVVPNRFMTEAEIINYARPEPELSFPVAVGVHYNSDLAHVERVTLEEARKIMAEINGKTPTSTPLVRYHAFADSSINFNVYLRAGKYFDQFLLRHEFIKRLHRRFNEEGIVIPFPIRTLDIPSDQLPTLADQSSPADVDPPAATDRAGEG